jgi:transposase
VKKYIVRLTPEEQAHLWQMLRRGKAAARILLHARILLKADSSPEAPAWSDEAIREALEVHETTVARVRQRFVEEGLEAALRPKSSSRQYGRKLDGKAEAHLIALVCSAPPEGRAQWTLRLLADQLVELQYVGSVSHETVRQTLKKTNCSLTYKSIGRFRRNTVPSLQPPWKTY